MVPAKVRKPAVADGPGAGAGGGRRAWRTARSRVRAADGVTS